MGKRTAKKSNIAVYAESVAFYLYLAYFPPTLLFLASHLHSFTKLPIEAQTFIARFAILWLWATFLARGNDLLPEISVMQWAVGRLTLGEVIAKTIPCVAGGMTVALLTQSFGQSFVLFRSPDIDRYNLFQCFFIEFGFGLIAFSVAALSSIQKDLLVGQGKTRIRGFTEIVAFGIVAVHLLGIPFTRGGPNLNSVYCLLSGVHHQQKMAAAVLAVADVGAAAVAGRFVQVKQIKAKEE